MHTRLWRAALLAGGVGLLACSPALDWREIRPPGTQLVAMFPCKPAAQQRQILLAGQSVSMSLLACTAAGKTWGLAHADVVDPALLGPALDALRAAAAANIGASIDAAAAPQPLQIPGATPHPASARARLAGKRPDGAGVEMRMAVFVHGTRVFQATVLGPRVSDEEAGSFFSALRISR